MVLEDDEVNQELLGLYLSSNYTIKIVSTIEEALQSLADESFDLIISDIHLGNGTKNDGNEFLKMVRANPATENIPIVAYTAFNNPNDFNEEQFTHFISKPITKADFLEVIKKLLAGYH